MNRKRKKSKGSGAFKIFFLLIAILLLGAGYYYYCNEGKPAVASIEKVCAAEQVKVEKQTPVKRVKQQKKQKAKEIDMAECMPYGVGEIVRHSHYVLGYCEDHEQAAWVYYTPSMGSQNEKASRTDDFREDPMVETGSAVPSDYRRSGYDRGHLCPAGDMTSSREVMSETFYMSNMSPQVPAFNRGIWKRLEEQVRDWGKRETVWIVTGPVFKDVKGEIGTNKVTVPGYYYKVVYSSSRREMIGFILPNERSKKPLSDYVVSVDSVERFTDLDFFRNCLII